MKERLKKFVEDTRGQTIVNIENATAFGIILRWCVTNKLTIVLVLVTSVLFGRAYYLENLYLKERNKTLVEEKEAILERTKVLESRIISLKEDKLKARDLNDSVRKEATSLSTEEKKNKVLKLIQMLKDKRGIL